MLAVLLLWPVAAMLMSANGGGRYFRPVPTTRPPRVNYTSVSVSKNAAWAKRPVRRTTTTHPASRRTTTPVTTRAKTTTEPETTTEPQPTAAARHRDPLKLLPHNAPLFASQALFETKARAYIALQVDLSLPGMRDALRRSDCAIEDKGSGGLLVSYMPVDLFKGDECTIRVRIPRESVDQLPANEPVRPAHRTCAVVGNSNSLTGRAHGAAIDAASAVIRINGAPTDGFEADVGRRTTYDVVNHKHAARVAWPSAAAEQNSAPPPPEVRPRPRRRDAGGGWESFFRPRVDTAVDATATKPSPSFEERNATLVLFESMQYRAYERLYKPLFLHRPPPATVVLSPSFGIRAMELWYENIHAEQPDDVQLALRDNGRCARRRDGSFAGSRGAATTCARPLSGWFAVLFAVAVCENVHVYGFSDAAGASLGHYFDNVNAAQATHAFGATRRALTNLGAYAPVLLRD